MLLTLGRGLAPAGSGQGGELPSAPAPFTGLLDGLEAAPLAAYSTRRLSGAYAGPCLRLRRAGDDAEQDFGFDTGGALDSAAVTAWLSGASGHVAAWYDQSGNAADLAQTSPGNQPLIETAAIAGLPAVRFVKAAENFLERPAFSELNVADPPWSSFFVHRHAVGTPPAINECIWCQGESDEPGQLNYIAVRARYGSSIWAVVAFRPIGEESEKKLQEAMPPSFQGTSVYQSSLVCSGISITWRKNKEAIAGIDDDSLNAINALLSDRFTLGCFNRTTNVEQEFLGADIPEFLLFCIALSDSDRDNIEVSQATEWEI